MANFVWDSHLDRDDLWFRAACHEAAAPAARPVKARVVRRLAEAEDTALVWSSVASATSWASPTAFFERLIADVRWRTLVTEAVASERRWSDLRDGVFQDFWDRALAWWDKVMRAAGPAVGHATTLAAAGAGSLVIALQVAPLVSGPLKMPIQIESANVHLSPQMDAIPLKLMGSDALTIPVSFRGTDETPLRIQATLDADDRRVVDELARMARTQMDATSRHLSALAEQARSANEQMAESRFQLTEGLGALTHSAADLRDTVESGVRTADTMRVSAADLHAVAQVGLRPPLVTTVALGQGTTKPVELVWVDLQGRIVDCVVDLSARTVSSSVTLDLDAASGCPQPLKATLRIDKGTPAAVPEWPFKFALERVERPLFGTRSAYLRITRTEGFERDQRRTARPGDSSRATGR